VDVVGDGQSVSFGAGRVDALLEIVLGNLDFLHAELIVVISIEVEGSHDIAEGLQVVLAGC
jgi:hypothetical protein